MNISNYLTLGQVADAVAAVGVNEQQLYALGFPSISLKKLQADGLQVPDAEAKRLRQARLYEKSLVPHIRAAIAQQMITLNLQELIQQKS